MIPEDQVEKALDWLRDNAVPAAKAKADRIVVEAMLKVIKSKLMKSCGETTAAAQEREAEAHPDYERHLQAIAAAVELDETFKWRKEAAQSKIEAWRTMCSNERAAKP